MLYLFAEIFVSLVFVAIAAFILGWVLRDQYAQHTARRATRPARHRHDST